MPTALQSNWVKCFDVKTCGLHSTGMRALPVARIIQLTLLRSLYQKVEL